MLSLKEKKIKYNKKTQDGKNKNYKKINNNDDNIISSDEENSSDDEELDIIKYRKYLKTLFPSKHLDKKIKSGEKVKNTIKQIIKEKEEKNNNIISKKYKKTQEKHNKPSKKISKKHIDNNNTESDNDSDYDTESDSDYADTESDSEYETESDTETETETESDTETDESEATTEIKKKKKGKKNEKINIILTIGDDEGKEYDSSSDWEDIEDEDTEDEDKSVSSCSTESSTESIHKKSKKEKDKNIIIKENTINDNKEIINKLKDLTIHMDNNNNKDKKILDKCIKYCEEQIEKDNKNNNKKIKKQKNKNSRIFKKIMEDKNSLNDNKIFYSYDTDKQIKLIKEMRKINEISRIEKPYRILLLESNIPVIFKSSAMKKISLLKYMDTYSSEYYKMKTWVDAFMRIPFGKYIDMDININDGVEKCHSFMENSLNILNKAVYGLNDAKIQIMQLLGQLVTNPTAIGSSIALYGPPGTGKTTLFKEGVSKILNRPFAFVALGGATDSSFLEGHSYTYEGSVWGKIVQILIDSRCMNPVIYFDELDKISDTPKGEEILNILVHLTDTTQNNEFHDKYFSDISFDLSRCLFIFSYNDKTKINPILLDRMYKIKTGGYNNKEKVIISNNYLLPKIRQQINFNENEINISNEMLNYIIENYTNNEKGVRNIKRCLEIIYSKINLFRLMKSNINLFQEDINMNIEFPFTLTKDNIDKLIKRYQENYSMKYLYI